MVGTTERNTKVGFALALVAVAAAGAFSYRMRREQIADNRWVSHTLEVLEELDIILLHITDAESGQLGYVITGDQRYLEFCQAASAHLHDDIERLERMTSDNAIQQQRIPHLKKTIDGAMESIHETVELRRTQGTEAASLLITSGKGMLAAGAVRQVISDMRDTENGLLRMRTAESERANFQGAVTVLTLGMLIIALVLTTYGLLHRDLSERTKIERGINAQNVLARTLAESSTLAEAMVRILRVLGEGLGWERGEFWVFDREAGVLRLGASWRATNIQFPAFDAATAQITFAPGVGLPGQALNSGEVIWVQNLKGAPEFTRSAEAISDGLCSAIAIPIKRRGEVMAVMEFFSLEARKPKDFMLKTAAATGSQVGQFVDRMRGEEELQTLNRKLSVWVHDLELRANEITVLSQLGSLLQSCLTIAEAAKVIAQFGAQLFPEAAGAVYATAASRNVVESVAQWGDSSVGQAVFAPEDCWALRSGRPNFVESLESPVLCTHASLSTGAACLCVPMMAQGEALGILHLRWLAASTAPENSAGSPKSSRHQLALAVAEHLGLGLANLQLRDALHSQSIRDPLTNLFNRRYMEESLPRDLKRASRNGGAIGLIMLDIDHFKRYNDTFGHEAGDVVLRELGTYISTHIRGEDVGCRFGGEEFVLIMPDSTLEITRQRAAQLCEGVKHIAVTHHGQSLGVITISLGVSSFPEHGETASTLLGAADKALYRAKERGRNQVVVWDSASSGNAHSALDAKREI